MATATEYPQVWDLDSLVPPPDSAEFRSLFEAAQKDLTELATASAALPPAGSAADAVAAWRDFCSRYATVSANVTELDHAVGCHCAADANNKSFQQWEARIAALTPLGETIRTAIEFGLQNAGDEEFAAFIAADPYLTEIRFALEDARRLAQLRLPREQELLAADLGVDGIHAWGRLYDRISGELRVQVMEKGELVERSISQLQFDVPDRSVRENNFHAANKSWAKIADTCADSLNHIAGTRLTRYRRLGLADHLQAPLVYNRMQRETLDAMWSAISARKNMLVQYLDAKARLLGQEKLSWFDIAAPLSAGTLSTGTAAGNTGGAALPWNRGCQIVIDTFRGFSPDLGDFAEMSFSQKWIEASNRPGKRQGGFCTGFPNHQQSRIFMTYTDTPDSMSTLAHELGHAYHSWVLKDRPLELRRYPMNLAETASTFAEAVLGDERLAAADSDAAQLQILDNLLSDSVAFLMNIHCRFLFENAFHEERAGGELTSDRLSELMLSAQQTAYAGALADDGWNPLFWASKLHFYISTLPFYNFPYTFGYLLSLGLYALKDEAGDEFPQRYREFLLATGCEMTEDAIRNSFGDDVTQTAFWDKSLNIVEARVQQFLALAGG